MTCEAIFQCGLLMCPFHPSEWLYDGIMISISVLRISYWLELYIYVYWLEKSYGRDAGTMILFMLESYIRYKKGAEEGTRKMMVYKWFIKHKRVLGYLLQQQAG